MRKTVRVLLFYSTLGTNLKTSKVKSGAAGLWVFCEQTMNPSRAYPAFVAEATSA